MLFSERYGPWAVVTGASEGTGREFARQIAAAGMPSILIARREEPLGALADEIRADTGIECITATIDLAVPDAFDRIVDAVGNREIGLFVSNAGADPNGALFLDRPFGAWMALVQRNAITMMECCHHFAGPMRARGSGGLLLVNSGACYGGSRFMAAYSASKAFTLAFAEGLWDELHPHGVDVLTLVMHMTDTPALRALLAEKGLPVPDAIARPADVAALGLARLPHGPVQNWGLDDEEPGYAMISAANRRNRALAVGAASAHVFGEA
ncbi:SDR family NAD(P)-dependent oxidoreductase [Sphingomonas oligophenolica]|uniref:SDR family NAD(P)-dependent oxidoreductase n=1 Tax=Sphingomonas oligophenolica TaxID=301154 RepID=A0ABU9Y850_9SPHN